MAEKTAIQELIEAILTTNGVPDEIAVLEWMDRLTHPALLAELKQAAEPYPPVTIERIEDSLGGGYVAHLSGLPEMAFVGDGETPAEAYRNLMAYIVEIFQDCKEQAVKDAELRRMVEDGRIRDFFPHRGEWHVALGFSGKLVRGVGDTLDAALEAAYKAAGVDVKPVPTPQEPAQGASGPEQES